MKEFLRTKINWKVFSWEMFCIFAFLLLSYWAGNHKFPEKFWTVLVGVILIGLGILVHVYLEYKIGRNGKNDR